MRILLGDQGILIINFFFSIKIYYEIFMDIAQGTMSQPEITFSLFQSRCSYNSCLLLKTVIIRKFSMTGDTVQWRNIYYFDWKERESCKYYNNVLNTKIIYWLMYLIKGTSISSKHFWAVNEPFWIKYSLVCGPILVPADTNSLLLCAKCKKYQPWLGTVGAWSS